MGIFREMDLKIKIVATSSLVAVIMFLVSGYSILRFKDTYTQFSDLIAEIDSVHLISDDMGLIHHDISTYTARGDYSFVEEIEKHMIVLERHLEELKLRFDEDMYDDVYFLSNFVKAFETKVLKVQQDYDAGFSESLIRDDLKQVAVYENFANDFIEIWVGQSISGSRVHFQRVETELKSDELLFVTVTVFVLILSIIASVVIAEQVTRPIHSLSEKLELFSKGKMDEVKDDYRIGGDVGRLIDSAYYMLDKVAISFKLEREKNMMEKAKEIAEQSNKAKSRLLANMSHEIRTPLNAIIGYSQILQRDTSLNAESKKGIESIFTSGQHLLTLINDILDMSKINANKIILLKEKVEIRKLLEETQELFRYKLNEKNLVSSISVTKDLPKFLVLDKNRVRQIITNLIGNGIKFTSEGSIDIVCYPLKGELWVEVQDTGVGIDTTDRKRVFELFEQAKHGIVHGSGTGLGLPISKNLAQLMGGDIEIESVVGVGSSFKFHIPMETVAQDVSEESSIVVDVDLDDVIKVLIVDDNHANIEVARTMLKGFGFDVLASDNALGGIALIRSEKPDLVLMDIVMPDIDGLKAIEMIRKEFNKDRIIIIGFSASVLESEVHKVKEAGADNFISKPYTEQEMLETIGQYFELDIHYEVEENSSYLTIRDSNIPERMKSVMVGHSNLMMKLKESLIIGDLCAIADTVAKIKELDEDLGQFIDSKTRAFNFESILELMR